MMVRDTTNYFFIDDENFVDDANYHIQKLVMMMDVGSKHGLKVEFNIARDEKGQHSTTPVITKTFK